VGTRRGNSEGSITKRSDGRWEARISLEGGKRRCFYGKTRQEVARRLTEALRDQDRGLPIVGDRQTVAEYVATWLQMIRLTVAPSTVSKYDAQLRLHVLPLIGTVRLSKLTAQQVQIVYSKALAKGLSTTSVRLIHTILHGALKEALRLGLVPRNVADVVTSPRKRHHEMHVLTSEQTRRFLKAIHGQRYEALFVLAVTTGMREGELLALRWRDVDLEARHLQVRATLKLEVGQFIIADTKTTHSRRKIALTPQACDTLRRHRTELAEERLALGPAWNDHDLVFPNTIGRPFDRRDLMKRNFLPLLRKAGLPAIRFHDLRHTAATLMLLKGVHPKIVSEMLGHASIAITLDLYSHVMPDMQREAVLAIASVLEG